MMEQLHTHLWNLGAAPVLAASLGAEARRLFRTAPMGLDAHAAALRGLYARLSGAAAGAMQHPDSLAQPR